MSQDHRLHKVIRGLLVEYRSKQLEQVLRDYFTAAKALLTQLGYEMAAFTADKYVRYIDLDPVYHTAYYDPDTNTIWLPQDMAAIPTWAVETIAHELMHTLLEYTGVSIYRGKRNPEVCNLAEDAVIDYCLAAEGAGIHAYMRVPWMAWCIVEGNAYAFIVNLALVPPSSFQDELLGMIIERCPDFRNTTFFTELEKWRVITSKYDLPRIFGIKRDNPFPEDRDMARALGTSLYIIFGYIKKSAATAAKVVARSWGELAPEIVEYLEKKWWTKRLDPVMVARVALKILSGGKLTQQDLNLISESVGLACLLATSLGE